MKINFARLENFRNVAFADIALRADSVWIRGQNAQGKTNLLEALGLLYALRSFRTSEMSAMILHGQKRTRALMGISHENFGECEVIISISDKREASVDGEDIKFSDFIGKFPALAMGSEDIKILRGPPETRRKDADMFISSIDKAYFEELRKYHASLAQRNALLRAQDRNEREYVPFERQMAESAREISAAREARLGELGELASERYGVLARENGEEAKIKIRPNCDASDIESFSSALAAERETDIARRTTSRGPHRDDFKILIGGKDAKLYASEGQQRSAVIALKLAQFEMLKRALVVQPVILCDDILGELDASRRAAFWSCIDAEAQIIATSASDAPEECARRNWKTIAVSNGKFV